MRCSTTLNVTINGNICFSSVKLTCRSLVNKKFPALTKHYDLRGITHFSTCCYWNINFRLLTGTAFMSSHVTRLCYSIISK